MWMVSEVYITLVNRFFFILFTFSFVFYAPTAAQSVHIVGYGSTNFNANFRTYKQNNSNKIQKGSKYLSEEWMVGRLSLIHISEPTRPY